MSDTGARLGRRRASGGEEAIAGPVVNLALQKTPSPARW